MELGRHLIAVLLTAIGVIRAANDGVTLTLALAVGVALIVWHTFGARLVTQGKPAWRVGWLFGLASLWLVAVFVSAEFVWLAFLLWLLAGHLLKFSWALGFSLLVFAVVVFAPIIHHGSTSYANVLGPLIGGIFALGISRGYLQLLQDAAVREDLLESLTQAHTNLADLQDELALVERHAGMIAERTRLSRDIHDTVAQTLSSIRLLAHAGRTHATDEQSAATLGNLEDLAAQSLSDVRRIIAALAPAELEDQALSGALARLLERLAAETPIRTELHVDEHLPSLSTDVEVALLRTAQSALANVRLHADASRVVVSLMDTGEEVRLDIADDGRGFDASGWENRSTADSSSYGLRFMRARLRELGGGLDLESQPSEGTTLSAFLPLASEKETA